MNKAKKEIIYLRQDLLEKARIHSEENDISFSDLVNKALSGYYSKMEDNSDLQEIKKREKEPRIPMTKVLRKLKANGIG